MKTLQGQLLVATPQLPDANFHRAVVLMVEHNMKGALGVVLNRFVGQSVQELWHEVSEAPCDSPKRVNFGGPVPGPLLAVHTLSELAELEILSGIYLAAQKDHLDSLVRQEEHDYRIFLGHSGWGGGQLEDEIAQGAWLTTPATLHYVFHVETNLWETAAKHIGDEILLDSLHIRHMPDDPAVN